MSFQDPPSMSAESGFRSLQVVRFVGVGVLLASVWLASIVVMEAFALFDNQTRVIELSKKIQEHSGINSVAEQMLSNAQQHALATAMQMSQAAARPANGPPTNGPPAKGSSVRAPQVSQLQIPLPPIRGMNAAYFAAWGIVLLLLGLLGKMSCWGIASGGKLALHGHTESRELKDMLQKVLARSHTGGDVPAPRPPM